MAGVHHHIWLVCMAYTRVSVHTYVQMSVHIYDSGEEELIAGIFLNGCPSYWFLRWGLSLSLELADLTRVAEQQAPGSSDPALG